MVCFEGFSDPAALSVEMWGFKKEKPRTVSQILLNCELCNFETTQPEVLAAHLNKPHQISDPIRRRIESRVCPSCLFDFESRDRLLRHLQIGDKSGSILRRSFVMSFCDDIAILLLIMSGLDLVSIRLNFVVRESLVASPSVVLIVSCAWPMRRKIFFQ